MLTENLPKTEGKLEVTIIRKDGSVEVLKPSHNARVNAGFAAEAAMTFNAAVSGTFQYMALSVNTITPAMGDTALSGEIITNGCARYGPVAPTITNPTSVGGTGTIVFAHLWTATGSQVINSMGLLNAASGGTLYSELALSSTVTLASGDTISVSYTITK